MNTVELKLTLSDEILGYLQAEADRRKVPLGQVVSDVLVDYFDEETDEEILESLREGLRDVLAGRTYPIDELFDPDRKKRPTNNEE